MTYFHGGTPGLKVGALLLPPSVTKAAHTLADYSQNIPGCTQRRDRVYLTTDRDCALIYAASHPNRGAVYRVEPVGALEPDPDCSQPGLSYQVESAKILAVDLPRMSRKAQLFILRAIA